MKRIELKYLVDYWDLKLPVDLKSLFEDKHTFSLEIGHGKGEFLINRAIEHPHEGFIGIEQSWPSIVHALRRAMRFGVSNVRFFFGHVEPLLRYVFPEGCLQTIWILFPDPWPKARHAHHRFLHHRTWHLLWNVLRPDGEVHLATDEKKLFDWVLHEYPGDLFSFHMETYTRKVRFGTKYEKKWLHEGKTIFHAIWRKKKKPHIQIWTPRGWKGGTMNIYFFPRIRPEWLKRLKGSHRIDDETLVAFKQVLYDPEQHVILLKTVLVEQGWTQKLFIVLYRSEKGWTLAPSDGCKILPTTGLQKVLDFLAQAITSFQVEPES